MDSNKIVSKKILIVAFLGTLTISFFIKIYISIKFFFTLRTITINSISYCIYITF